MAVGHSAASVRSHGRRWIATSTTSCARASASPVTVSPCFGPCHALVPANCTRPTPRLSQLVNEIWCLRSRSPLVADADATGTPQLLWFRNGTFVGAYEGELDATAIKAWAAQKGSAEAAAGAA